MGFPARVGLRGFLGYWDLEHMEIFFFPSGPVCVARSSSALSLLTPELAAEVVESFL